MQLGGLNGIRRSQWSLRLGWHLAAQERCALVGRSLMVVSY